MGRILFSLSKILGFLPGLKQIREASKNIDDKQLDFVECIIFSMTEEERKDPKLIDSSAKRRERIAKGSGRTVMEVNRLRQMLETQKKTMKQMQGMSETDLKRMQTTLQNGNLPTQGQSYSKGKGKGRGQGKIFR